LFLLAEQIMESQVLGVVLNLNFLGRFCDG
jgi:hypothetical protein